MKTTLPIVVISFALLCLLAISFIISFDSTMSRFDSNEFEPGPAEQIAEIMVAILGFPLVDLVFMINLELPALFQWLIIGLNSVLWGIAIHFLRKKRHRT